MARGDDGSGKGSGGFKLFGVEINLEDELHTSSSSESIVRSHEGEDECMRKSKSMGNLHEICNREEHHGVAGDDSGYHSDGALHLNSRRAALIRKKGIPWTPSEHRSFLIGLKKLGKGVWKGISKNYVPTRTPTQVASHAQKYFIRLTAAEKKKRRASLFDIPFNESVGLSAHIAASERKPPLSPTTRTYVPDTWPAPYMAGVPGQSFPAAHDMPHTELYRMFNYSYPSYYSVPSSHVKFSAPFMRQKPNDLFLQHHPILDGASQGRPETPVAGNIAICAPFPNQYQTPNGPATSTVAKKDGPILALSL